MGRPAEALAAADPWDLSCPGWEQRLADGRSLVPTLPIDAERAAQAVGVFKKLRIPDVPNTPTMGEAAGDWIFDIVATIFGAFDKATAARMIRGLFLLVPKKNAKTTYGAAITVTAAVLNQRPRAELLMTAPSHEIADKAFAQARGMIELDDEGYLQKRFLIRDHLKTIHDRKTKANAKIKTFDASIVTGSVPAFALIDEVHLLGSDPQAEAIIAQLKGGMVSVPEGFWAMITTQSFKPPAGVFKSELKIARGIRDGTIKGLRTLPVLYEFSEQQQKDRGFWQEPANWARITPNLGRSITVPGVLELRDEAAIKGEEALRIWASQHLNVEIGLGLHSDRWAGADHWEKAQWTPVLGQPIKLTLDELLARCELVVVGADGGGLDDLLGMAVLGRGRDGKRLLWNRAWAHIGALERRKAEAARLRDFERDGDLVIVDRMDAAFAEMAKLIGRAKDSRKLGGVAVDPAGVKHILAALDTIGIPEATGISQGWKLSGAIKDVEIGLADGTLTHAAQPLMAWCVGNAKAEAKGNAITITKQVAGAAKIDPLVATFIAEALLSTNPAAMGRSFWDKAAA